MQPHRLPSSSASSTWPRPARGILEITRTLNGEGIANPQLSRWTKTTIHRILTNESYTGTLVWGTQSKDKAPPVRIEKAFPAVVTKSQFRRINRMLQSRAPTVAHPRRAVSPYLLSGLVKCHKCKRALSGQDAKSGQFAYYACHSLLKQGQRCLQRSQAQRQEVRGDDRRADSGQHPHREQYP